MLLLSGTMVVQTYFALSGFLLSVQFADKKVKVGHVLAAILYRFMR